MSRQQKSKRARSEERALRFIEMETGELFGTWHNTSHISGWKRQRGRRTTKGMRGIIK